jgi:hypothetical protein
VKCTDGRLYHPVIAEKALEAWAHRQKQRDKAAKRWHPPGNTAAHAAASATAMLGTGTGQGQDQKPAASQLAPSAALSAPPGSVNDVDPIVERIPLCDGSEFAVPKSMRDELDRLYPAVDPDQTLKEIRGWNLANPRRRKTSRGIRQHIFDWFKREQDKQSRRAA